MFMRSLLLTLLAAVALLTGALGCNHSQKWHECGGSQPMCSNCGSSQPAVADAKTAAAQVP